MGPLSKVIGQGIGMTKEWQAQKKREKSTQQHSTEDEENAPDLIDHAESSDNELATDEAQWELDESQTLDHQQGQLQDASDNSVDKILNNFFARHPEPPLSTPAVNPLPLPVVIPQKRPGTKLRGFLHAYAPSLEAAGIDQSTFLDFVDGLTNSIKYSPHFHAVNGAVAAGALALNAAAGPSIIVHAVALTIHISIEGTRRGYVRYQTNKYLDVMNERLFKPRGVYAMVFKYKPDSKKAVLDENYDYDGAITQGVNKRVDGSGTRFGGASGTAHSELELPECAELIFPDLELETSGDEDKKGKVHQMGSFARQYADKRARAKFEGQNPHSKLNAMPSEEFASRYSDPNHRAGNGNIVNLVTGGKIDRPTIKERIGARKDEIGARRQDRLEDGGRTARLGGGVAGGLRQRSQQRRTILRSVGKKIKEDVCYLMIVNLPSEEELERVRGEMDMSKIEL